MMNKKMYIYKCDEDRKYHHTSGLNFILTKGDKVSVFSYGNTIVICDVKECLDTQAQNHRLHFSRKEFDEKFIEQ